MADTFWPVYKSLESELVTLLSYVHCVDDQQDVYSIKNAEFITRTVVEIEAISKKLFDLYGGERRTSKAGHPIHPKFDEECLNYLDEKWKLSEKIVILSSPEAHISEPASKPLKTVQVNVNGRIRDTYNWNIAYQSLKHDREKSIANATIGNLIEAMKSLYFCLLYTSPSPRDQRGPRMPSSA